MTIQDTQIYRLEEIRDEINEFLNEAEAIAADSDDYIIADRAKIYWLTNIRKNIHNKTHGETHAVTMSKTIDALWEDWYNHVYTGEDE